MAQANEGNTYRCEMCGGTFETERSDADALMEYQQTFTESERALDSEPPALVCDDCYMTLLPHPPARP